jgi:uncharacterized membrane protein (UPF0127 family)
VFGEHGFDDSEAEMTDFIPTATAGVILTNARSREVIARDVQIAVTRAARRRGLLKHTSLAPDTALVLAPCFAVHTAFMRFAIDVVFVDRRGYVRHIVSHLQPWRLAASRGAYATIEFAAGVVDALDLQVGDRLCLGLSMSMTLAAAS